jgi:hypothetical protein
MHESVDIYAATCSASICKEISLQKEILELAGENARE